MRRVDGVEQPAGAACGVDARAERVAHALIDELGEVDEVEVGRRDRPGDRDHARRVLRLEAQQAAVERADPQLVRRRRRRRGRARRGGGGGRRAAARVKLRGRVRGLVVDDADRRPRPRDAADERGRPLVVVMVVVVGRRRRRRLSTVVMVGWRRWWRRLSTVVVMGWRRWWRTTVVMVLQRRRRRRLPPPPRRGAAEAPRRERLEEHLSRSHGGAPDAAAPGGLLDDRSGAIEATTVHIGAECGERASEGAVQPDASATLPSPRQV